MTAISENGDKNSLFLSLSLTLSLSHSVSLCLTLSQPLSTSRISNHHELPPSQNTFKAQTFKEHLAHSPAIHRPERFCTLVTTVLAHNVCTLARDALVHPFPHHHRVSKQHNPQQQTHPRSAAQCLMFHKSGSLTVSTTLDLTNQFVVARIRQEPPPSFQRLTHEEPGCIMIVSTHSSF